MAQLFDSVSHSAKLFLNLNNNTDQVLTVSFKRGGRVSLLPR